MDKLSEGVNLSDSQEIILAYILGGRTSQKALAKALDKSLHYIKYHLSSMYYKTGSKNMTDLVVWAYRRREARNGKHI